MDTKPSLVVSASCGLEPNKIINYKQILDDALVLAKAENTKTLIVQRE